VIDETVRFELVKILGDHFATRTRAAWMERLLQYDTSTPRCRRHRSP